jgi:hypothetical protein
MLHTQLKIAAGILWLVALSGAANAQVVSTFTGNIDGTEPEAYEVDDSTCTVIEPLFHYYETFEASVTETGDYDYTDQSIFFDLDMQLTIYTPTYDPTSVLTNCVTRFDDSGTVRLEAGVQYVFVVQPLLDDSFNTGDWEFDMTGPGTVQRGTAVPETPALPVPTLSLWALLLLCMTMLGVSGLVLARRC